MFKKLTASAFAILSISCGPVHNELRPKPSEVRALKKLAITIPREGEFTVINERAKATAVPAVLFGAIGAAVASSYNTSEDSKDAKVISLGIGDPNCRDLFRASLANTLEGAQGIQAQIFDRALEPKEGSGFDGVLELDIHQCGFRLVDQNTQVLAAFIELGVTLELTTSNEKIWDDRESIVGMDRFYLSSLRDDPEMIRREFEDLLTDAGTRIANYILYP